MVTTSVFMIARCSPLFEYPPMTLIVITFAGAMAPFLAATTGMLKDDLKNFHDFDFVEFVVMLVFPLTLSLYREIGMYVFSAKN
ncbi:hypothetical protein MTR67_039154 [Solanum verrucosum]|uniref:Uncharacterized protein n=1 Tax=Solanum verrucosum TaxID=315347 RepID=A0AAF0ZQX2_SOLVR|nr:hypothetical protein MTR67_039154 [Solanum verrucosum]